PAKTQENKRKQATGTTDKPAKAKRIKRSASRKTRQPRSSPKFVGASEAEEVPAEELQVADEDANFQKAVEESMKDAYALPKGPLPPVVIREPEQQEESEKIVLGVKKGGHDEGQAGPDPNAQAEDQTGSDTGAQAEGQVGSNPDETSEGQAGSNPDETSEGQAGLDPGNAKARVQSTSSLVVHAGSDREHIDLDVTNVSPQPSTEQLYEGFTATVGGSCKGPEEVGVLQEIHCDLVDWHVQVEPLLGFDQREHSHQPFYLHSNSHKDQTTTTGGLPGQVTIQSDFFFNKDLEYLRYGSMGRRPALSISKMKAAYYPNAGLEQMVPYQFWIEEECKYDIAAMYGISHWWFQRQRFYIDRHTSEGDHSTVRTRMRILSVVRIEVFSMYGYDYMKKIVLRRVDLNEHVIAERDFNYLYPMNLTKPQWTATGFEYKHDYTVIESPRDVIFRDKYRVQIMMRFNEIHKFSDGTLQQIVEALDYRVKEFRINRINPGLNTRFWTRKDVDRCNAFMLAIQRRLRTRRIFRNLDSFVGGRVREGDYRLLRRTD
nr:hypothetical protein [Tanacetum cinerariifolium]